MDDGDKHPLPPAVPVTAAASSATRGQQMVMYQEQDIPGSSHSGGGGGQMVIPAVHAAQQAGNPQQPNNQGGGGQMVIPAVHAAQQAVNPQQPNNQGDELFDSSYVDYLQKNYLYLQLENYLERFFPEGETWSNHPWLMLHIRRAWALSLVEREIFDVAQAFFAQGITAQFQATLQLDQNMVRNANLTDLADEISFIGSCVADQKCYHHPYNTEGMLEKLITDYFMLYMPNARLAAERKKSTRLWQFAVELGRKNKRPHFRCLVCTIEEFKSASIGDIVGHLREECAGPKRTPYLMEKYHANEMQVLNPARKPTAHVTIQERLAAASKKTEPSRKRVRTTATQNVTQERLESILQNMMAEMRTAETLSANVGLIHVQMDQIVTNMKGHLSAALAVAGSASHFEAAKAGDTTKKNRATEKQPVTIVTPSAPAAATFTSYPIFRTSNPPTTNLGIDLNRARNNQPGTIAAPSVLACTSYPPFGTAAPPTTDLNFDLNETRYNLPGTIADDASTSHPPFGTAAPPLSEMDFDLDTDLLDVLEAPWPTGNE